MNSLKEQPSQKRVAYSPAEFAAMFGHDRSWTYRLLYKGQLKAIQNLGRLMIPESEIARLLKDAEIYSGQKCRKQNFKASK